MQSIYKPSPTSKLVSAWNLDVLWFHRLGGGHAWRPFIMRGICAWARHRGFVLALLLVLFALLEAEGGYRVLQALGVAVVAQMVSKKLAALTRTSRPFSLGLSPNHIGHSERGGMPSTHATVMFAVVAYMAAIPSAGWIAAALCLVALTTAWSRILVGAHFPSDTLVGMFLGVAIGLLAVSL